MIRSDVRYDVGGGQGRGSSGGDERTKGTEEGEI